MAKKKERLIDVLKRTGGFVSIGIDASSSYIYIEKSEVVMENIDALDEYLKTITKNKIKRAEGFINCFPSWKKNKEKQIEELEEKLKGLADTKMVAKELSRKAADVLYEELRYISRNSPKWIADSAYKSINSGCGGAIKNEIEKERDRIRNEIDKARHLIVDSERRFENSKIELVECRKYMKKYVNLADRYVLETYDRVSEPYGIAIKIEGEKWERGKFWTYDEIPEGWDFSNEIINDEEEDDVD